VNESGILCVVLHLYLFGLDFVLFHATQNDNPLVLLLMIYVHLVMHFYHCVTCYCTEAPLLTYGKFLPQVQRTEKNQKS